MDPAHWKAIASIESSLNPNIKNQFGYQGLYQMGGTEWATYGGGADWRNPEANAMGAARLAAHKQPSFVRLKVATQQQMKSTLCISRAQDFIPAQTFQLAI